MPLIYPDIKAEKDDAPEFITMLNKIASGIVWQFGINEITKVRIKNWFDHKWLTYSGKAVVTFEGTNVENALENKWQKKITVPPFHPNRVLSQKSFSRKSSENIFLEKLLHTLKSSNNNLHNRMSLKTSNGLFIWYSSNSLANQKASVMLYRVQEKETETFYASFENQNGWTVKQTKGIDLNEIKLYLK